MPKLTAAQRVELTRWSLDHNGWGDGTGYPGKSPNPACKYMGLGTTYSCACGVTTSCGKAGFPLVSMQPGFREGYAYCPDALTYGRKHKAVIDSWKAKVGDILLIDTGGGAQPGHTEQIFAILGTGASRRIFSVGWDSGPSNMDRFVGQGGTHRHAWTDPVGKGNPSIMAVLDVDRVIDWTKVDQPEHAPKKAKRKKLTPAPQHKTPESRATPQPEPVKAHRSWWIRAWRRWMHGRI